MAVKVLVVSDTHLGPDTLERMPAEVWAMAEAADVVLHAGAQVVVFGHSHQPLVEQVEDGPLLVNPSSPTQRRHQPVHTVAWLELRAGRVARAEIVEVGPLAARSTAS